MISALTIRFIVTNTNTPSHGGGYLHELIGLTSEEIRWGFGPVVTALNKIGFSRSLTRDSGGRQGHPSCEQVIGWIILIDGRLTGNWAAPLAVTNTSSYTSRTDAAPHTNTQTNTNTHTLIENIYSWPPLAWTRRRQRSGPESGLGLCRFAYPAVSPTVG